MYERAVGTVYPRADSGDGSGVLSRVPQPRGGGKIHLSSRTHSRRARILPFGDFRIPAREFAAPAFEHAQPLLVWKLCRAIRGHWQVSAELSRGAYSRESALALRP